MSAPQLWICSGTRFRFHNRVASFSKPELSSRVGFAAGWTPIVRPARKGAQGRLAHKAPGNLLFQVTPSKRGKYQPIARRDPHGPLGILRKQTHRDSSASVSRLRPRAETPSPTLLQLLRDYARTGCCASTRRVWDCASKIIARISAQKSTQGVHWNSGRALVVSNTAQSPSHGPQSGSRALSICKDVPRQS
jgi:hypothetical protein